ncbi:MAG: helix-turn-helix transcriptional regulator [Dehalococcoidia bacterium]|nr:helix-turn-helix transcriptional regulator [Dehalococcoidia bacterium]
MYVRELLRGVVETLLLIIIDMLPSHGYQIAKELNRRSHGYFKFSGSTVYSALRRLEDEGLVLSSWEQVARKQDRRCYEITGKGRQILTEKLAELQRFYRATSRVISNIDSVSETEPKK